MSTDQILLSLASFILLILLVSSGVLWIKLFLRLSDGQQFLPERFRSKTARVPPFTIALVCLYIGAGLWQKLTFQPSTPPDMDKIGEVLNATISEGLVVILALSITLVSLTRYKTDFYRLGFRFDQIKQQFRDGALGFLAALIPVFSVLLLTMPLRSIEKTHPFLKLLDSQGAEVFVAVFVAAVVVAPLMEELVFRVILQSTLVRWCGARIGITITAILFAAVHGLPDALGLLPLAFILGYVYYQRRSFISIVLLHSLFNAFNISLLLLQNFAETVSEIPEVMP